MAKACGPIIGWSLVKPYEGVAFVERDTGRKDDAIIF